MALNFYRFLVDKDGTSKEVKVEEIIAAATELNVRILAFNVCVNMIANAIGKCEFKTLVDRAPVKDAEYYTLNVEPNINQNSSAFWHEVIHKLYTENEVLVISTKHRDGHEMLVVADSWDKPDKYPAKMNEYRNVAVGKVTYNKTFRENDVIHLVLNHVDIKPLIDKIYESYKTLLTAAQKGYTRSKGVRMKVKVEQTPGGEDDYAKTFQQLMSDQVKPFVNADSGVLPEFEGYEYTDMNKGQAAENTRDIRALIDDVFTFTARSLGIPPVLVTGEVADSKDAVSRWLTVGIDPLCYQIEEEFNRKRYGFELWKNGAYMQIDTSTIQHFDMFANAANIEKLIGSGAFSINDVLTAAGLPEINEEWARMHWLTRNIGTIDAAAIAAENGGKGGNAV